MVKVTLVYIYGCHRLICEHHKNEFKYQIGEGGEGRLDIFCDRHHIKGGIFHRGVLGVLIEV